MALLIWLAVHLAWLWTFGGTSADTACHLVSIYNARLIIKNDLLANPLVSMFTAQSLSYELAVDSVKDHPFICFVKIQNPFHFRGLSLHGNILLLAMFNCYQYSTARIFLAKVLAIF